MIGYQQPVLSINWTVAHIMLVIGQYASFCMRCCGALCWVNCWVFLSFYNDVLKSFSAKAMLCSFLKFCHSFDWLVTGHRVVQFSLYSYLWLTNQTPALWPSDFVNHSFDDRPNWTPLSPITIINTWLMKSSTHRCL